MQSDGWQQRSCEDFVVEEVLWDVGVRVGGVAMETRREGSLPSIPGEGEGMGTMWGGAFGGDEMPLVDSAGGAGWVVKPLGVADLWRGNQGDGRGLRLFYGSFGEPCELSGYKWRCPDCAAINPVEFYE